MNVLELDSKASQFLRGFISKVSSNLELRYEFSNSEFLVEDVLYEVLLDSGSSSYE